MTGYVTEGHRRKKDQKKEREKDGRMGKRGEECKGVTLERETLKTEQGKGRAR